MEKHPRCIDDGLHEGEFETTGNVEGGCFDVSSACDGQPRAAHRESMGQRRPGGDDAREGVD